MLFPANLLARTETKKLNEIITEIYNKPRLTKHK